jgi:hypothetical protein
LHEPIIKLRSRQRAKFLSATCDADIMKMNAPR